MTNEEYIKSYTGKEFKDCIDRFFTNNAIAPYIDWERWLANERSAFFFKGVPGTYTQKDGSKISCTVVEKILLAGTKACRIIIFKDGKYYLYTTLEEQVECQNI